MSEALEYVWRDNGTLCLAVGHDPAIERVIGYRRFWLACDPGQQDPAGIVVIQDECVPVWHGTRQVLAPRTRTIVHADILKDASYSALADHLVALMAKPPLAGRVRLITDATSLGRPFSAMLLERRVRHCACTITAGNTSSKKGDDHAVSKNILLGDFANALETQSLRIASNLPLRARLEQEIAAFETKTTAAGNTVLESGRSADTGHSDIAISAALGLYLSNNAPGFTGEAAVAGYWG